MSPFLQELHPPPDPARCCELLRDLPYRIFLDSAATGTRHGRCSFLTADPVAVVRSKGPQTELLDFTGSCRNVTGDALTVVRTLLAPHHAEPLPELPPFQGGAAGYIGYDWARLLEQLPAPRHDDLALPDVVLGVYDWVVAWDHDRARCWVISTGLPERAPASKSERAAARAAQVLERIRENAAPRAPGAADAAEHAAHAASFPHEAMAPSYPVELWDPRLEIRSSFSHAAYLAAVTRVRDYIVAGDIFQANLSQRFESPLVGQPWDLYCRLRARNASPFGAYLDLPEAVVLSASPERFLQVDTARHVETRPIKGTRPRGTDPHHDAALARELTKSAKDLSENLMIVDLMRNDLSRVCRPGSVHVPEAFSLESFATVHHLVSTIVGDLEPGRDALDLVRAAFPAGSITGAPKLRAMEIIAELEPSARGVYCGAIGYWSVTGALDTNVAIRTATVRGGRLYFNAGGAIVADSDPEQEYRETLDKARGLVEALAVPA